MQSELSQKCSELEFVQDSKESREMEMKQLEEKLQVNILVYKLCIIILKLLG